MLELMRSLSIFCISHGFSIDFPQQNCGNSSTAMWGLHRGADVRHPVQEVDWLDWDIVMGKIHHVTGGSTRFSTPGEGWCRMFSIHNLGFLHGWSLV